MPQRLAGPGERTLSYAYTDAIEAHVPRCGERSATHERGTLRTIAPCCPVGMSTISNQQHWALVVDDDVVARRMVAFALGQAGFQCDLAVDGLQASDLLKSRVYDLVITDLAMPNKHGHSLVVELLAGQPRPVIMVHSSIDDSRLTGDLLARGVDDIVYKPANYATVAARAKALVEGRRRGDPLPSAGTVPASPVPSAAVQKAKAELMRRLGEVSNLFPLSQTALRVYELAMLEDAEAAKIAAAVECDASLTAELLRIGNSAFYNRSGARVVNVKDVVIRVGYRRTGELALAANAHHLLARQQIPWVDLQLAWRRSLAAGIAIDHLLGKTPDGGSAKGLFLSAIFHPLGRIVLATLKPTEHETLVNQCRLKGESLDDAEEWTFGLKSTDAVARLLAAWKIPASATAPLAHVGHPFRLLESLSEPERGEATLLKLAIFLGRIAAGPWEAWDTIDVPPARLLDSLRLPPLADVLARVRNDLAGIVSACSQPAHFPPGREAPECRRVGYVHLFPDTFDFLAAMLPSIGIEPTVDDPQGGDPLLINALDVDPACVGGLANLDGRSGVVIAMSGPDCPASSGVVPVLAFPTTCTAVRTACG